MTNDDLIKKQDKIAKLIKLQVEFGMNEGISYEELLCYIKLSYDSLEQALIKQVEKHNA